MDRRRTEGPNFDVDAELHEKVQTDFLSIGESLKPYKQQFDIELKDYSSTFSYRRPRLDLKYPENIIVVSSPSGDSPPPERGETRCDSVAEATRIAAAIADMGGPSKWCIVVHNGYYLNNCRIHVPSRRKEVSYLQI